MIRPILFPDLVVAATSQFIVNPSGKHRLLSPSGLGEQNRFKLTTLVEEFERKETRYEDRAPELD